MLTVGTGVIRVTVARCGVSESAGTGDAVASARRDTVALALDAGVVGVALAAAGVPSTDKPAGRGAIVAPIEG